MFILIFLESLIMKKVLMAIDPSLSCTGVAVFNLEDNFEPCLSENGICIPELESTYSIDTKGLQDSSRANRLSFIFESMTELREKYSPKVVVYESGFSRFVKSTQAIYQVQGVMLLAFSNIKLFFYPPSSIKKTICGKGNVKKELVRDEIMKIYPEKSFANMDETDAVAIGIYHINNGTKAG